MPFPSDDRAVSPVVSFILVFAITSAFLMVVTVSTAETLQQRHEAAARVVVEDLAQRMANAVEEALYVVSSNPSANYEKRLPLPPDVRGLEYLITVTDNAVYVNTTNRVIERSTPLHNPNGHTVTGTIMRHVTALVIYDPGTAVVTLEGGA